MAQVFMSSSNGLGAVGSRDKFDLPKMLLEFRIVQKMLLAVRAHLSFVGIPLSQGEQHYELNIPASVSGSGRSGRPVCQ